MSICDKMSLLNVAVRHIARPNPFDLLSTVKHMKTNSNCRPFAILSSCTQAQVPRLCPVKASFTTNNARLDEQKGA